MLSKLFERIVQVFEFDSPLSVELTYLISHMAF